MVCPVPGMEHELRWILLQNARQSGAHRRRPGRRRTGAHVVGSGDASIAGCRPAHGNVLAIRSDVQRAVRMLLDPIMAGMSDGSARVRIGTWTASYSRTCQHMEAFCRALWGLVPFLVGGGTGIDAARFQEGLAHGADPDHREFWGYPNDCDQRLVEFAAVSYALLAARNIFWEPLPARSQQHVVDLLATINSRTVRDNNWRFFRVLTNSALMSVGGPHDDERVQEDLSHLDRWYLGGGWYCDGDDGARDYYVAFGMHFYALLYAAYAGCCDAERASVFRYRANLFARDFVAWFSPDGSAIPYGRSLSYRSAQAAFWGALPLVNVESRWHGVAKGILLRHLRWWLRQPILRENGVLAVGYGYENPLVAENYTSCASPYWALKAFLPLALPEEHPFWRAQEADVPVRDGAVLQRHPQVIVCRDGSHVFALAGAGHVPRQHRNAAAKYAKFCYSNHFGFNVRSAGGELSSVAPDSMLTLSDGDDQFRGRTRSEEVRFGHGALSTVWRPWPDVAVTTWLVPFLPWHVRVHRLETARVLKAAEGGFALGLPDDAEAPGERHIEGGVTAVNTSGAWSVVADLLRVRSTEVLRADPNTNVLFPRSVIPVLRSTHVPGTHWLACAVAASVESERYQDAIALRPEIIVDHEGFRIVDSRGHVVLAGGGTSR